MKLNFEQILKLQKEYENKIAGRGFNPIQYGILKKQQDYNKRRRLIIEEELNDIIILKNKKILDVGCEFAGVTQQLAEDNDVTGIDIALPSEYIKGKAKILNIDANNTPFKNNTFDLCISLSSIEHFNNPNNVLDELFRITKVGGYLYLITGGLYYSNLGGHLYCEGVNFPFPHLLANIDDIEKLINKKLNLDLNKITLKSFNDMIQNSQWKLIKRKEYDVTNQDINSYEKFKSILGKFSKEELFTESVLVILKKDKDVNTINYNEHIYKGNRKIEINKTDLIKEQQWIWLTELDHVKDRTNCIIDNCEGKVLDIGCGQGVISCLIAKYKNLNVIGIDYCYNLIKIATELSKVNNIELTRFSLNDATNINLPNSLFDTIVISQVLEHLNLEQINKIIYESIRICKINGKIIISVPADGIMSSHNYKGHITDFNKISFIKVIEKISKNYKIYIINGNYERENQSIYRIAVILNEKKG